MKRLNLPILLYILLASASAWGRAGQPSALSAGVAGFDTNIVFQIHDNGYFRSTATNYGYFGTVRNRLRDSTGESAPVFEAPPHSKIEYLYEAGLWIGGIVGDDTLVSTGSLEFGQAHELYADAPDAGIFSDYEGDEEWTFSYGDSTTDPETVRDDPYDGPHRPLPVRVRQKTYLFDAAPGKSGLFAELVITNVGTTRIDSLWVGWMFDPDIGHPDRAQYWIDDITGHERRTMPPHLGNSDFTFAWAMDNDGDPDSMQQFDDKSPTRAFGSMFLGATPGLADESYNWWIPSFSLNPALRKARDWGPQRAPGDTNIFGGRGNPATDRYRYRLMSNRELDYPQPYAAVDRSLEGWMPPTADSFASDYANGYDTRFLHSVGSVNLAPGDSLVVHWVFALSTQTHSSPTFFDAAFDPADPGLYLSGLGLADFGLLMGDLRLLWDSAFTDLLIRPPRDFRISSWDDSSGVLTWTPRGTKRLTGYQVLRFSHAEPPDAKAVLVPASDSVYIDVGLNRTQTYYYTVSSVGSNNSIGSQSPIDSLLPDRPMTPARPMAVGQKYAIALRWLANVEPDIRGYRLYRHAEGGGWDLLVETTEALVYVDSSIATAQPYEYRVSAISALDNESYPSAAATAVAFAFDGPPQILDYTGDGAASLTDKDSVASVWSRLLSGAAYRDASARVTPFGFADFNPHPVTVVVSDGRSPLPEPDFILLDLYSRAQAPTIITGRDLFNPDLVLDSLVTLPPGSIGYAAGIRRAYYPRTLLASPTRMNAEFVGAKPHDRSMPQLDVDPARTGWGLNPVLPDPGNAIPFVGYFEVDTSRADVLYRYVSKDGAGSPLHGKPVAVMAREAGRTLAVFAFPLSYIEESDAKACVTAVLSRMGYGSTMATGDADNDGVVTAADLVLVVNYLYRDGYLIDEDNADVSGDCRVDVLDAVYLVDFVYGGVALPTAGCAP